MYTRKVYKFYFIVALKTLSIKLKSSCDISIVWRRGQQISKIENPCLLQNGICNFQQSSNKLQLPCNVIYNQNKQTFQQKMTIFTIVLYSTKGKKQAGQVNFDLADLLNSKNSKLIFQKSLEKCPDLNAKLTFQIEALLDGQVNFEQVKQETETFKSQKKLNRSMSQSTPFNAQKLDFKKKKVSFMQGFSQIKNNMQILQNIKKPLESIYDQNTKQLTKIDICYLKIKMSQQKLTKYQFIQLNEENKKLKEQLLKMKQIQNENLRLKQQMEQKQKSYLKYYERKFQQIEKQLQQLRQQHQKLIQIQILKSDKLTQIQHAKQRIGRIINYAIQSGNYSIAQQIFQISQT